MIYSETMNGLAVTTGDVICTTNGTPNSLLGRAWQIVGLFVPGYIDHTILYVGPKGGCIEATAQGVIYFEMPQPTWAAERVAGTRLLHDTLVGVAYPLQGHKLAPQRESAVRQQVADFCRAQLGKPYNLNYFAPALDDAFYCSQLIYQAYAEVGIDLLQGHKTADDGDRPLVITPQMIWDGISHRALASERGHNPQGSG
jgi:cell wall-associated NlpC family hydrolase